VALFHTNFTLSVNVSLTAHVQNFIPVTTNQALNIVQSQKLATKDIVNAIGTDIGNGTNHFGGGELLFRFTNVGETNEDSEFVVRANGSEVIVSNYFDLLDLSSLANVLGQPGFLGLSSDIYTVTTDKNSNGIRKSSNMTLWGVTIATSKVSTKLVGILKYTSSPLKVGRQLLSDTNTEPASLAFSLSGSGIVAGKEAIFQGTISAGNRKAEVVPASE
jgi:hypothetical protein